VVRIETRPLSPAEEQALVEEVAVGPSRGETGCLLAGGLLGVPVLGWLVADNLADWLGLAHGPSVRAGALAGLAVGALWAAWPFLLMGRAGRRLLRDERRARLAAGPVERWTFEPARGWNVECRAARALLLELTDGRLVLLASRRLDGVPADSCPGHVEMEVLPQLDRVLSLGASGVPRPTEPARLTLEELGNDYPLKARRFSEITPLGLGEATRSRLGLPPRAAGGPALTHDVPARRAEAGRLALDRAIRASEPGDRLTHLAGAGARVASALLTWGAPVIGVVAVVAARAAGIRMPRGGAAASVFLVLAALWVLVAAPLGEMLRFRSAHRALRRGRGPLVHVSGRARALRTFPAPLTGRPAVVARVDLLLGEHGLMQGVDFDLVGPDGAALRVDVREARLLREGGDRRIVRVETHDAQRLLGNVDADWARTQRFQFPGEDVVGDGDAVHVLGRLDPAGVVAGTPGRPLLLWTGDVPRASLSPLLA
jgi:hypothetical protein